MIEIFDNVNLVVGMVIGVVLLVWIGVTDSELQQQERENDIPRERKP